MWAASCIIGEELNWTLGCLLGQEELRLTLECHEECLDRSQEELRLTAAVPSG
jgi:hypothetical protein